MKVRNSGNIVRLALSDIVVGKRLRRVSEVQVQNLLLMTEDSRANSKLIAEQGRRITELERLSERLTDRIEQVPSRDMMHRLDLQLAKMEGELGRIVERLHPVAAIAERMQELMIEQAKGK